MSRSTAGHLLPQPGAPRRAGQRRRRIARTSSSASPTARPPISSPCSSRSLDRARPADRIPPTTAHSFGAASRTRSSSPWTRRADHPTATSTWPTTSSPSVVRKLRRRREPDHQLGATTRVHRRIRLTAKRGRSNRSPASRSAPDGKLYVGVYELFNGEDELFEFDEDGDLRLGAWRRRRNPALRNRGRSVDGNVFYVGYYEDRRRGSNGTSARRKISSLTRRRIRRSDHEDRPRGRPRQPAISTSTSAARSIARFCVRHFGSTCSRTTERPARHVHPTANFDGIEVSACERSDGRSRQTAISTSTRATGSFASNPITGPVRPGPDVGRSKC